MSALAKEGVAVTKMSVAIKDMDVELSAPYWVLNLFTEYLSPIYRSRDMAKDFLDNITLL